MKQVAAWCAAALVAASAWAAPPFAELLGRADLTPADLAVGAPPDWLGHPPIDAADFLLPHVPSVRADPRRLVELGRNWQAAASRAAVEGEGDGPDLLALATVFLLQPRFASFRGFPLRRREPPPGDGLLTLALARLEAPLDLFAPSVDAPPWPALPPPGEAELALPAELRRPLAELVLALADARRRVARSWRGVESATVERALAPADVPRRLSGGEVWWPALDDAARHGDAIDRAAALLRLVDAVARARELLRSAATSADFAGWSTSTGLGRIVVAGRGADEHVCDDARPCALVVDLGGDDVYLGAAASARWPERPAALVLDLEGDDLYRSAASAQAAALGGVALLADLDGDDIYQAGDRAQAFALLGEALLYDAAGADRYTAAGGAQGAAVFGGALLVDGGGDDVYSILGEGQGFGGPAASGVLVDLGGADRYLAEPNPAVAVGRADLHTDGRVAASNAQGAGVGRRGDLTDGHGWAGGVGALVDVRGDDAYRAGTFAQAVGYQHGTGLLLDGAGDDTYRAAYFAQGSGAHFSLALLLDTAGDDRHLLEDIAGASLGYGWDFALSLFVDLAGDDLYHAQKTSLGSAERSSVALFLDLAGADVYELPPAARHVLGAGGVNPDAAREPGDPLRAASRAAQIGCFIDLGGEDVYPETGAARNGATWGEPARAPGSSAPHVGVGMDLDGAAPTDGVGWLVRD